MQVLGFVLLTFFASCFTITNEFETIKKFTLTLKAMNQSNHVTSVIAITVCNFIQKLITKIDF